jgi:phage tail sheath protein FI
MADVFKTPGVYIKEIPSFPPSIAEVETAIPAFIGYTEQAIFNGKPINDPVRITSLLEYEALFGKAQKETAISVTITDVTVASVTTRTMSAAIDPATQSKFKMYYALQMYFANGGGPCYIASAGNYSAPPALGDATTGLLNGLAEIATFDEPTILVFPDAQALGDANFYALMKAGLDQCALLQDRFLIMDVQQKTGASGIVTTTLDSFRGTDGAPLGSDIEKLKYGAAYFPNLETILNYRYDEADVKIKYFQGATELTVTDADAAREDLRMSHLSKIPVAPDAVLETAIVSGLGLPNSELYNQVKQALQKVTVVVPASPVVAGVYAKVDSSRGVWKAPANESLSYVTAATVKISHQEQMNMNVDPTSGKSLNAIRYFTGKGLLIWGSRTLAGNDNEWRYVPVRRFFNFAEESIKKGSEWVVFEPNDANTWVRVKAMIENFLLKQWRAGALAGAKPEQAFFVKVGLGVTMTALDILEGRMNIEIGMAVVRPAEFIILKFSHKLQES